MTVRRWLWASLLLAAIIGAAPVAVLAADPPPTEQHVTEEQAMALLKAGKREEARQAFQTILDSHPSDPSQALYVVGEFDLEDGHWQDAKPLIERLVKLRPASYQAWELMVQTYQASGETDKREDAIRSMYTAWRSALDPSIRSRVSFVRDRIFGPQHTVLAQQTLETGGDDIVRFVFQPADELGQQRHLIVVGSDNETNERWREDGTVPYGTVVYHLDTVERLPNGRSLARPYEFYLEPPSYEKVRAKVAAILAGTAQPLSGPADPFWTSPPAAK